jgi:hypothetical protein
LTRLSLQDRLRIIKFVHRWWPTGHQLHQIDSTHPAHCPSCRHRDETEQHIIRCRDPPRIAHRITLLDNFRVALKALHTHVTIELFLMTVIRQWIQRPNYQHRMILANDQNPHMQQLRISAQFYNKVGWHQLLNGRLHHSIILAQLHSLPLASTPAIRREVHTSWAPKLTLALWHMVLEIWKTRNADLHGATYQQEQLIRRNRLQQETTALYTQQHLLPAQDLHMFRRPLAARLQDHTSTLQIWTVQVQRLMDIALAPPPTPAPNRPAVLPPQGQTTITSFTRNRQPPTFATNEE